MGKLANFLVYTPSVNLLEDDICGTMQIRYVVRGGWKYGLSKEGNNSCCLSMQSKEHSNE
jgi:hypothetical protein